MPENKTERSVKVYEAKELAYKIYNAVKSSEKLEQIPTIKDKFNSEEYLILIFYQRV